VAAQSAAAGMPAVPLREPRIIHPIMLVFCDVWHTFRQAALLAAIQSRPHLAVENIVSQFADQPSVSDEGRAVQRVEQ
jgi:hypothetical protein